MFWALALKANKRYSQTLKKAFHLSNAALDVRNCADNEPVQVVISHGGEEYVLCNLRKNKIEQVAFDLTFGKGEKVAFTSQGNGNVHLSGYLLLDDFEDEFESSDDEEDNESNEVVANQTKKEKKKKAQKKEDNSLLAALEGAELDDDEEEDSDFQVENDDDDDDEDAEEEEEDSDDDDEDEEDSDDDEEVEEPKPKQIKLSNAKQNGLENGGVSTKEDAKKDKKKDKLKQKQQQQQQQQQQQKQPQQQQKQQKSQQKGGEKTVQAGVKIEDIHVGNGPEAKPGKKCAVYYEGRLKQNNKVFDSTKEGKGFKFAVGKGEVIKGWDIGVVGMKVGGKRRIVCPPHVAYGVKGHPPVIPPNSTLVFDIELKSVN